VASECIYLSDNLPLSYTTNGWIAAHLRNLVHVHGYQAGLGTHLSGSGSGLTARVSRANNNHIILEIHTNSKVTANYWNKIGLFLFVLKHRRVSGFRTQRSGLLRTPSKA
jgi:hypothetical protein